MGPDSRTDQSSAKPEWRARLRRLYRVAVAVWREMAVGQLSLHAMSLVYTTLLSLVPLLAVSFSVLKAFGVHNQIEPLLKAILEPLGPQSVEITTRVTGFVEHMEVGVLGAVGLSMLFYTVVSLIQKIEAAFNYAWRVAQPRAFAQRFSQYLSVLMVGPILVFSALAVTGTLLNTAFAHSLLSVQPLGALLGLLGRVVPYVLVIAAFTFIYAFIPNTKVRIGSALLGATVAGMVWQTGGWAFGSFIASSTQYTAIYAGFAIVILFMIWLYLSWLILLLGASIAFYYQHPEYQNGSRAPCRLSARTGERLALWSMALIGRAHLDGAPAWTAVRLARQVDMPTANMELLLDELENCRLVVRSADDLPRYIPARTLETITLQAILDCAHHGVDTFGVKPGGEALSVAIDALCGDIDAGTTSALQGRTLRDLVATVGPVSA